MKNLKLIESVAVSNVSLASVLCCSIDFDTTSLFCCTSNSVIQLDPSTYQVKQAYDLTEYLEHPSGVSGIPISIQYVPHDQLCTVITSNGETLLWNIIDNEIEAIGSIEEGISGASWSPDQELIAIVTNDAKLLLMSREFNPIAEVDLFTEEFGEAKNVNVGWGTKATQFHGSAGKQAATETRQEADEIFASDDRRTRISWRGDGAYFSISVVDPANRRRFKLYTRECHLFSTGEETSGLDQCMAYRPSGSLVAFSQCKKNRRDVIFFEQNGLQHGEFTLPVSTLPASTLPASTPSQGGATVELRVKELLWDLSSTVLAVWSETVEDVPSQSLQFWTCSNYKWMLKYELIFSHGDDLLTCVLFDPEVECRVHTFSTGGLYRRLTFIAEVSTQTSCDLSLATTISVDGGQALVTPFLEARVPPPMCAYSFTRSHSSIIGVSFLDRDYTILYSDLYLAVASFSIDKINAGFEINVKKEAGICTLPNIILVRLSLDNSEGITFVDIYHFTLIDSRRCLMVVTDNHMKYYLCQVNYDLAENSASIVKIVPLQHNVRSICIACLHVLLHLEDNSVLAFKTDTDTLYLDTCRPTITLPQKCNKIISYVQGDKELVLGLTERYRLYANNIEIANNCTSFVVQPPFLILTTHSHVLRFIPLSVSPAEMGKAAASSDLQERTIERGARLVTISQANLILQMPRGNIEIVEPRPLLLVLFKSLMDKFKYREAFMILRKHRINMNLLYDHDPVTFTSHLHEFIEKLQTTQYINLFLTSLKNEDVTQTTFANVYQKRDDLTSQADKVNHVCDIVHAALNNIDLEKYRLSILTSLVCRTEPLIEQALQVLTSHQDIATIKNTLEYLIFLIPVDKLYDHALGTYNFELTVMVAEKSLKDPKEYIPYLNTLKQLTPLAYQHYTINLDLRRYSKALADIAQCKGNEHFARCQKLVIKHKLYKQALTLYKPNSPEYKALSTAYGDHLIKHQRFSEAGLVLSRCKNHWYAAQAYLEAADWTAAMRELSQGRVDDFNISEFLKTLVEKLVDSHKILDAARVLTEYADNFEEAIIVLIKGLEWEEALRLIYKHEREDFIETDVLPAIEEAMEHSTDTIERANKEFSSYLVRLKHCRLRKVAQQIEFMQQAGQGDSDLYSETSSVGGGGSETGWTVVSEGVQSLASTRTNASSKSSGGTKNRKRNDRKKHSLREGGIHEEQALVDVLSKIIVAMNNLKDEICALLKVQVLLSNTPDAIRLQDLFAAMLLLIDNSVQDIWTDQNTASDFNNLQNFGPQSTANDIAKRLQSTRSGVSNDTEKIIEKPLKNTTKWRMTILEAQRK